MPTRNWPASSDTITHCRPDRDDGSRGGWIERSHFGDACASLWIDGELVYLEDLFLHDATKDVRTPTDELTIARDRPENAPAYVCATTRLGIDGRRSPRQAWPAPSIGGDAAIATTGAEPLVEADGKRGGADGDDGASLLDAEFAVIDAVLRPIGSGDRIGQDARPCEGPGKGSAGL